MTNAKQLTFEILLYTFEYIKELSDQNAQEDQILELPHLLEDEGYPPEVIQHALDWFFSLQDRWFDFEDAKFSNAQRILCDTEIRVFNEEARGFLHVLEQEGIIRPILRELIIDSALDLGFMNLDLHFVKWIILMVLFAQPGEEHGDAIACVEFLISEEAAGRVQ